MELKVKSLLEDKGKIRCVLSYRKRSIASVNRCLDEPYCSALQPKRTFYRGVPCIFQTLHTGKTILVIPHYQRKWMLVAGCSCWLLNVVAQGRYHGAVWPGAWKFMGVLRPSKATLKSVLVPLVLSLIDKRGWGQWRKTPLKSLSLIAVLKERKGC